MPNLIVFALSAMVAWQAPVKNQDILAPYYPTPELVVQKMLEFGGLKAGETMFDLGSGDGRIVFMAAQMFHANAIGVGPMPLPPTIVLGGFNSRPVVRTEDIG